MQSSSGSRQSHNGEKETCMTPVESRLHQLRPSRELLEYYRQKIAEFDNEHEDMVRRLDQYRCTYEEQHKLQWTMRQREQEIAELQRALSDMQVYLFQEREQVLRLYSENDRLRIREVEDRQRIQHLLTLTAPPQGGETTYFHPVAGGRATGLHRRGGGLVEKHKAKGSGSNPVGLKGNKEASGKDQDSESSLALTVQSLQAQLEEQTRLAKQQVDSLLQERKVAAEEAQACSDRDSETISSLTERLRKTQDLLYDSTRDYLGLKYEMRARERGWASEKDKLLCEMDRLKTVADECAAREALEFSGHHSQDIDDASSLHPAGSMDARHAYRMEIDRLRDAVKQQQQLADMYREQCVQLEEVHGQLREKHDSSQQVFSQRSDRMAQRLALMNERYQNLERRRALEVEGFRNDIKGLRQRLKDLEKQLYKVTVQYGDDLDMEMLKSIHQTTGRCKHLVGELNHLKTKVYSLENDVRNL